MPLTKTKLFNVQSIQKYQSRVDGTNHDVVKEYAERYRDGKKMAPIDVCGSHNMGFFIFDGHQRFAAMKQAGFTGDSEITVNVVDARIDQAVVKWLAAGANTEHGLRRTNEDKRRAVIMALESHPEQSDRAIADHVGVSAPTVGDARKSLETTCKTFTPDKRTGMDGKQYPAPPPPPPKAAAAKSPPPASIPPTNGEGGDGTTTIPSESSKDPAGNQGSETANMPAAPQSRKRDDMNRPIPEDLQDHWNRRVELMSHIAKLKEIQRAMVNGRQAHDPLYAQITQETIAYTVNVINALEDSQPYAVCPWCGGMNPGCKMCGNRGGFVSRFQIERFAKADPEIWKLVAPVPVEEGEGSGPHVD